jgi:hypothetical protein
LKAALKKNLNLISKELSTVYFLSKITMKAVNQLLLLLVNLMRQLNNILKKKNFNLLNEQSSYET